MHHPAENNVFISAAMQKVQQITDVVHHHLFRLIRHLKRIGVPAPVAVKKNAVRQIFFQLLTYRRLANAHRSADQI